MILDIINELNLENGSNYKISVLKKHSNNELLKRVLKMTCDKVSFTYGVSMKNVGDFKPELTDFAPLSLDFTLASLETNFCTRDVTGHAALQMLSNLIGNSSPEDAEILKCVINRDLRINMGRSNINKVLKDLIVKPPYTRCEIGTAANILKNMPVDKEGNFKNKVFSQVKMDGTFRRAVVDGETIEITSRPGIETEFPLIESQIRTLNVDGNVLIGEMTLRGETDRKKGNGLINSDDIPHDDVIYTVWDMVPVHEFGMTKDQIKAAEKAGTLSLYEDRLTLLEHTINNYPGGLNNVELIEYKIIKNMREAYEHFQEVTKRDLEGTVIKAHDMTHKDGNSKKQLKVKLIIEIDVRFTGFTEGTGKNADYFGAITFENDEGTIKGRVGVSSMTEDMRDYIHANRDIIIGQVGTVICNDITKSRSNDFHALSHPRFDELRGVDKITDTLERAFESREMAMELK
jgi:DNA ligase-1